ncbi:MAG: cellulase family glycosylhydrolase [Bacteroidales bacterium]|nr:cellulase family glycosylhydrolase [Bacteroidales bacterium]
MNRFYTLLLCSIVLSVSGCSAGKNTQERWSAERAGRWYADKGWVCGCDYIPAYAINQLEMWQEDTFDINEIDKELGWAEEIGFNCMRVFLHHLLWETDREGLKARMDKYLETASSHGISTMFVFLDDCWDENAAPGKQRDPMRGIHNSGWVKDPGILYFGPCGSGCRYAEDTTAIVALLEAYVKDIMAEFKDDERVFAWDLYNEPGSGQDPDRYWERSFPLLKSIFGWAREVNPSQPLTAGIWHPRLKEMNDWQIANSDIITYHTYDPYVEHRHVIDTLKPYGRPMVCTEYMARTQGSTFASIMPMLKEENVGAINWGFVAGKTNTVFAWSTPLDADEPELWFHDVLRKDGTPYIDSEVELIKTLTGRK